MECSPTGTDKTFPTDSGTTRCDLIINVYLPIQIAPVYRNPDTTLAGTGKSETGAHIAYALATGNRIRASGECVLYCAPTNKAVDVVLSKFYSDYNTAIYVTVYALEV